MTKFFSRKFWMTLGALVMIGVFWRLGVADVRAIADEHQLAAYTQLTLYAFGVVALAISAYLGVQGAVDLRQQVHNSVQQMTSSSRQRSVDEGRARDADFFAEEG
jgi:hypothetical protein